MSSQSSSPIAGRNASGRRVTKACARCRKRKIKCDFQFPTCGNCALVRTECLGFDAARGAARPRSTISHLENQIAQLEIELSQLKEKHSTESSFAFSTAVERLTTKLAQTVAEPWRRIPRPNPPNHDVTPLASSTFLSPSPLPKFHNTYERSLRNDDAEGAYQSTNIASIPRNVIDIMLKNYCETYLPQYPAIEEEALYDSCSKIYLNEQPDHWDYFTVAITLAISANTLIRHDEKRAIAAAGEFWATAKERLSYIGLNHTWQRVQALQLLAHYGLLNPRFVNCSQCASAATRLCIQLGLHRELSNSEQEKVGMKVVDARRRLFWTSYSLDAAFHSVLCQPYVWPKGSITTKFPSSENPIFPTSHVWELRQLEAEVTLRMYFPTINRSTSSSTPSGTGPLPDATSDDTNFSNWFSTTSERLHQLSQTLKNSKSGLASVLDLQTFRLNHPSPRYPTPTSSMNKNSLAAAITLTNSYDQMERQGKFFYIWYAAHYLSEISVSFLETLLTGLEAEAGRLQTPRANARSGDSVTFLDAFDPGLLTRTLRTFPILLSKVASRWPDVQQLAWSIDEISAPVLRRLEKLPLQDAAHGLDYEDIRRKLAALAQITYPGQEQRRDRPSTLALIEQIPNITSALQTDENITTPGFYAAQNQIRRAASSHVEGVHGQPMTHDINLAQESYSFPQPASIPLPSISGVSSSLLPFPPSSPYQEPHRPVQPQRQHVESGFGTLPDVLAFPEAMTNSFQSSNANWATNPDHMSGSDDALQYPDAYIVDPFSELGGGSTNEELYFWDLAGLDLDQIFAALLEGRDGDLPGDTNMEGGNRELPPLQ